MRAGADMRVFVMIVGAEQGIPVDLMITFFVEDFIDRGAQAFVSLDQRAVAIKGQPEWARGVLKGHAASVRKVSDPRSIGNVAVSWKSNQPLPHS